MEERCHRYTAVPSAATATPRSGHRHGPLPPPPVPPRAVSVVLAGALLAVLVAACGGGGGGGRDAAPAPPPPPPPVDTDNDGTADDQDTDDDGDGVADVDDAFPLDPERTVDPNIFADAADYAASCAAPRSGADSFTGRPFEDRQGSARDEKLWLRSWSNDLYLWYDEIEYVDPVGYSVLDYFDRLRTFARTPSGAPKDQFHFTYDTATWRQLSQSGVSAGYGAEWVLLARSPPREIAVAFTEPDSPAALAELARGTRLIAIDGVDVENGSDVDHVERRPVSGRRRGDARVSSCVTSARRRRAR